MTAELTTPAFPAVVFSVTDAGIAELDLAQAEIRALEDKLLEVQS